MNRSAVALHPEMIFARTSFGASEAVNSASHLASDLRFLLILVDGQSTLGQLQQRYDGDDLWTAASALWLGDYIRFVHDASVTKAANAKEGSSYSNAPQGTGLWDKLADTLSRTQPVPIYRPDSSSSTLPSAPTPVPAQGAIPAPHEVRFSASGKYWFSLGGQQLSADQIAQLEEQQHGLAAMHAAMQGATKTLQPAAPLSPEQAQPLPAVLPNAPGIDTKAKR
jgi:hypothetical protein